MIMFWARLSQVSAVYESSTHSLFSEENQELVKDEEGEQIVKQPQEDAEEKQEQERAETQEVKKEGIEGGEYGDGDRDDRGEY